MASTKGDAMATTTKTPRRPKGHGRPLDEARAALTGVRDDLRTGGRDLYGDVATFVRSTRHDASKLGKALRADVEQLAQPLLPAPPAPPARRRSAPKPRRTAGSHPKKTAA
jgi:hypothetical protein